MEIKEKFFLQHKLPWEYEWIDVECSKKKHDDKFLKILRKEPEHIIETEYRIIKKEKLFLKKENKAVYHPILIFSGFDIVNNINSKG
jgi:hypothetical protein